MSAIDKLIDELDSYHYLDDGSIGANLTYEARAEYNALIAERDALKKTLDEAHENLLSMVNQYCLRTVKKTGEKDTYSHDFMSTGEEAFEYLVSHGLAKWCDNGVDIFDLKWPSALGQESK